MKGISTSLEEVYVRQLKLTVIIFTQIFKEYVRDLSFLQPDSSVYHTMLSAKMSDVLS